MSCFILTLSLFCLLVGKNKKKVTKCRGIVKQKRLNKKGKKVLNLKVKLPYVISPKATSSTPNNLCMVPSKDRWIDSCVSPIRPQSSCISGITPKSSLQMASPKDMFAIEGSNRKADESTCDMSALVAGLNNLGLSPKASKYLSNIGHRRSKIKSFPGKRSNICVPHTQVSSNYSPVQFEENESGVFANVSNRNFTNKKHSIFKIEEENLDKCSISKMLEENKENCDSVNLESQAPQHAENVESNVGVKEFRDEGTVLDHSINESQSKFCQTPVSCRISERISCRISQQKTATPKKDSSYNFSSIFKEPQITLLPGKKWRKSFIKQKQSGKLLILPTFKLYC